jgi:hypothetical protein
MTGQHETLLWHANVDDPLTRVGVPEEGSEPELFAVAFQGLQLGLGLGVLERPSPVVCWYGMVNHPTGQIRSAEPATGLSKAIESLVGGDLVNQMAVYIYDVRAPLPAVNQMRIPEPVQK